MMKIPTLVRCIKHKTTFKPVVRPATRYSSPHINCPTCGRGYHLVTEEMLKKLNYPPADEFGQLGEWFSDRPLEILATVEGDLP